MGGSQKSTLEATLTIARMPALITSGKSGQATTKVLERRGSALPGVRVEDHAAIIAAYRETPTRRRVPGWQSLSSGDTIPNCFSSGGTIANCLGEFRQITENNERAGFAVDVNQAGTPRTAGVDRLMPRENGQRLVGGKLEKWFDLSAGIAWFGA